MTFEAFFETAGRRLRADLSVFLAAKRAEAARLRPWGPDVLRRLERFTRKGKAIRGGLVALGCEMAGGRAAAPAAVRAGAAFELIQSGLLIHDDIMDRDPRRRGGPSVHEQYARLAPFPAGPEAAHFGTSLAICAGEIAIFLAFEAIAGLPGPAGRTAAVDRLFASEFGLVGLGQMLDIEAGASRRPVPRRRILEIYRVKTARYSFYLPLAAGWLLGGGRRAALPAFERLGQDLGLVFQIKDDELGLFGLPSATGKPVGSDIREGKKTLYATGLLERAAGPDAERLSRLFGCPAATDADIRFVQGLAERLGVRAEAGKAMDRFGRRVLVEIAALPVRPAHRDILRGLHAYIMSRRR
ncbi:MAG: polyprenyl synthetase family protein [Acidobacteriota bacterium]